LLLAQELLTELSGEVKIAGARTRELSGAAGSVEAEARA
jgi:hypothetical protein